MKVDYRASNSRNDYFSVADAKVSHVITVVHTQFDTFVCLTDRRVDCEHSKAVEGFVKEGGGPQRDRS